MPEYMRSPEVEPTREILVEKDRCLRNLTSEAVDRAIDSFADRYLIEQLNDSHVSDTPEGYVLNCQVSDCSAQCILSDEGGILRRVSESGDGLCEQ